jgi:hypothetical protein
MPFSVGASLTGFTVIDTVAGADAPLPSFAVYVKLSVPLKSGSGVYWTLAVHTFGVRPLQVTAPIAPSVPLAGPVPIANVDASPSASLADSVTVSGASSSVERDWFSTTGGVLTLIARVSE